MRKMGQMPHAFCTRPADNPLKVAVRGLPLAKGIAT